MRERRTYGSVRGARSNARPYRDFIYPAFRPRECCKWTEIRRGVPSSVPPKWRASFSQREKRLLFFPALRPLAGEGGAGRNFAARDG